MSDVLKRGDRVGEYKIVSKLGQGGFGITYRATDKMRREVAIKEYFPSKLATRSNGKVLAVAHSTYEDYAQGLKQFHREARFIAKLDHLNIVRILHVFEQNGTAYIVSRYEHGIDLNRYMHERKRPLNYIEIAVFFTAILDGLRTVHKKGVLHLDIKPSNILIRRDANSLPCLIGFGGARHSAAQASFEASGKFNFTVATDGYSPPEQYDTTETEKSIDPRVDVYALGATMYTCMVGQEELKRSTNRLVSMTNQNYDPVVPAIERFEGRYPPALLELVDSCHSIRKDLRPKDAETVQHRLVKIVNGEKRRYEQRKQSPEKDSSGFGTTAYVSEPSKHVYSSPPACVDHHTQLQPTQTKIKDRLNNFFSGIRSMINPSSQPTALQNENKSVDFSVFSLTNVNPNQKFILYVWAYLEEQFEDVQEKSSRLNKRLSNLATASGIWLRKGTNIVIRLEIKGIESINNEKNIYWNEKETNVSFPVHIPKNTPIDDYFGIVRIICSGIEIACIDFTLSVTNEVTDKSHTHQKNMRKIKSAFISYSRKDSADVFRCKQGMEVIAPDIDFFLDVKDLRSGDNWEEKLRENIHTKEKFLLFWSKNAAHSKWVEREWRIALEAKGIQAINPVPIDPPEDAPPPLELNSLHFNDQHLAYISNFRNRQKFL